MDGTLRWRVGDRCKWNSTNTGIFGTIHAIDMSPAMKGAVSVRREPDGAIITLRLENLQYPNVGEGPWQDHSCTWCNTGLTTLAEKSMLKLGRRFQCRLCGRDGCTACIPGGDGQLCIECRTQKARRGELEDDGTLDDDDADPGQRSSGKRKTKKRAKGKLPAAVVSDPEDSFLNDVESDDFALFDIDD